MIRCRNCDLEIEEREIEANDGCCPECGAPIFIGGLSDEEEEAGMFEDEGDEEEQPEDDFEDEGGDMICDDDDFDSDKDEDFPDEDDALDEVPPAPKRRGRKKKNS